MLNHMSDQFVSLVGTNNRFIALFFAVANAAENCEVINRCKWASNF